MNVRVSVDIENEKISFCFTRRAQCQHAAIVCTPPPPTPTPNCRRTHLHARNPVEMDNDDDKRVSFNRLVAFFVTDTTATIACTNLPSIPPVIIISNRHLYRNEQFLTPAVITDRKTATYTKVRRFT